MSNIAPYRPEHYEEEGKKSTPWHPRLFLEGKIDTLPYEHESVVLYHGINHAIFFEEDYTPDIPNKKSALKTEIIKPGNSHSKDSEKSGEPNKLTRGDKGVYCGVLGIAETYARDNNQRRVGGGAVIEIQLSTKALWTLVSERDSGPLSFRRPAHMNYSITDDRQSLLEELGYIGNFGAKKNFRKLIERAIEADSHMSTKGKREGQVIHFATRYPVNIDKIKGVWDVEAFPEGPVFESFEEYIGSLKAPERYGKEMPGEADAREIPVNKVKSKIEGELRDLQNLENILSTELGMAIADIDNELSGSDRDLSYLLNALERYEKSRDQLRRKVKDLTGKQLGTPEKITSVEELASEAESITNLGRKTEKELRSVMHEEKKHATKNNWTVEKWKQERQFESEISELLVKNVGRLPNVSPLIEKFRNQYQSAA